MKMRTGGLNYGADSAEGYAADDSAGFRHGAGNAGGFRYAYRTNFSNSFHKIFSEVHCTSLYPLSSCSMFLSLVSNWNHNIFDFLQIFEDEANHFASDIQVNFFHCL